MENPRTLALPPTHRAHLIRSTRKLGALLGETPLVDAAYSRGHTASSSVSSVSSNTNSTVSKRSGRIFAEASTRSSSLAVDRSHSRAHSTPNADANMNPNIKANAPAHARPTLYLRLAAPARPISAVSLVSPTSPTFSPRTPTFSPAVARRRKMAKLARTLGHNVPPELVFSSVDAREKFDYTPSPSRIPGLATLAPARPHAAPSSPVDSLASPTREASASATSYHHSTLLSPRTMSAMSMRRGDSDADDSDGYEWVDAAPASYPPAPRSPHYVRAPPTWTTEARASPSKTSRAAGDARFLSRRVEFRAPSPAEGAPSRGEHNPDEGYESDNYTHRREHGWSGEWSGAQGMGDVVSRLRGLKTK
ncbi:hypothetical protein B0H17DRAFT_1210126 [Mycena rosella]|uniref:Uncharacterized protein n=1 Tax=Mycena rosella TaxID=1033263 RepID=A0AAD7CXB2_MYCRO|nr:hypothetical protein B0H17DRAFT_1210126 [Mycena rosella]